MDRDVAQLILSKLTDINSALSLIVGNTTPSVSSASSLSMVPMRTDSVDDKESASVEDSEVPQEEIAEPEAPAEPKTRTKK